MALLEREAALHRAVLAAHVALQLMDRRMLRPAMQSSGPCFNFGVGMRTSRDHREHPSVLFGRDTGHRGNPMVVTT